MNHETLYKAVEAGISELKKSQAVFKEATIQERFSDGMVYGETKEAHAEIETLKGKSTKKWVHVTIYRHETGRYEVNSYIL